MWILEQNFEIEFNQNKNAKWSLSWEDNEKFRKQKLCSLERKPILEKQKTTSESAFKFENISTSRGIVFHNRKF